MKHGDAVFLAGKQRGSQENGAGGVVFGVRVQEKSLVKH
jgi:hypothetical protein